MSFWLAVFPREPYAGSISWHRHSVHYSYGKKRFMPSMVDRLRKFLRQEFHFYSTFPDLGPSALFIVFIIIMAKTSFPCIFLSIQHRMDKPKYENQNYSQSRQKNYSTITNRNQLHNKHSHLIKSVIYFSLVLCEDNDKQLLKGLTNHFTMV